MNREKRERLKKYGDNQVEYHLDQTKNPQTAAQSLQKLVSSPLFDKLKAELVTHPTSIFVDPVVTGHFTSGTASSAINNWTLSDNRGNLLYTGYGPSPVLPTPMGGTATTERSFVPVIFNKKAKKRPIVLIDGMWYRWWVQNIEAQVEHTPASYTFQVSLEFSMDGTHWASLGKELDKETIKNEASQKLLQYRLLINGRTLWARSVKVEDRASGRQVIRITALSSSVFI